MKHVLTRFAALLLAMMTLCTLAAAEKTAQPLFESEWKQIREVTARGKEKSLVRGSIYTVYRFNETEYMATSYMGTTPAVVVTGECAADASRITLTLQHVSRSGQYTIDEDTLAIAWDDGALLEFSRVTE